MAHEGQFSAVSRSGFICFVLRFLFYSLAAIIN